MTIPQHQDYDDNSSTSRGKMTLPKVSTLRVGQHPASIFPSSTSSWTQASFSSEEGSSVHRHKVHNSQQGMWKPARQQQEGLSILG